MSRAEIAVAILLAAVCGGAVLREIIRRVDAARPRSFGGAGGRSAHGARPRVNKK